MNSRSKALLLSLALLPLSLLADSYEDNLKKLVQEQMKTEINVLESKPVDGIKGLRTAIIEVPNNNAQIPMLTSEDGQTIILMQKVFTNNDATQKSIDAMFEKAAEHTEKEKNKKLDALFASIPDENFITIDSGAKETFYVVTDPECPYCRKELEQIEKRLEEVNLKLIIAPVHDTVSHKKGELIYQAVKKAKNNKEIIAILKKYFDEAYKLTKNEEKTDPVTVKSNMDKIFGSGLIRGVPFMHPAK